MPLSSLRVSPKMLNSYYNAKSYKNKKMLKKKTYKKANYKKPKDSRSLITLDLKLIDHNSMGSILLANISRV